MPFDAPALPICREPVVFCLCVCFWSVLTGQYRRNTKGRGALNNSVLIQEKYHHHTFVFASIFHKLNGIKNKCVMVIF